MIYFDFLQRQGNGAPGGGIALGREVRYHVPHRTLGTFPTGTVRFRLGAFSATEEVKAGMGAVR